MKLDKNIILKQTIQFLTLFKSYSSFKMLRTKIRTSYLKFLNNKLLNNKVVVKTTRLMFFLKVRSLYDRFILNTSYLPDLTIRIIPFWIRSRPDPNLKKVSRFGSETCG